MEKRLGIVAIIVEDPAIIPRVNNLLSEHSGLIVARLGLPMHGKGIALISLVVEGDTDGIGALTGRLGKIAGVKVKSVLTAYREDEDGKHIWPEDLH
jgi:putative iron-only hydrogenase system regulator